ncbi:universal stress protein [Nocardioides sp. NPDC051685]|uniref:universal stress protein n=1 Tax=Nocardioides sp. NPDC051685 TaxID=3364334 RepID=UPI0037ADB830
MRNEVDRTKVVVGVDGSERNRAAIYYAVAAALATGRPLMLVGVVDVGLPDQPEADEAPGHEWLLLEDIREGVMAEHPRLSVRTLVRFGHPVSALLASVGEDDLLVVGKRGMGPSRSMRIGTTALRIAARASSPLVVVPPWWRVGSHHVGTVVVGVDPAADEEKALRMAFLEAMRSGAALRVVSAVDLRPMLVWDKVLGAPLYRQWEQRSVASLAQLVGPFREEFPGVAITVVRDHGHAADVLTDHSGDPQLIVLGRDHPDGLSIGLGAVAREVLNVADVPVLVVPVVRPKGFDGSAPMSDSTAGAVKSLREPAT